MKLVEASKVENCKCKPVENIQKVLKLKKQMTEIMDNNNGIGLAGPQVGIFQRFFIMKNFKSTGSIMVINPTIDWESDKLGTFREGCLTYKGETFIVKRPKQIKVTYVNEEGETVQRKLTGRESQVFHHETDQKRR